MSLPVSSPPAQSKRPHPNGGDGKTQSALRHEDQLLRQAFLEGKPAMALMAQRRRLLDRALRQAFREFFFKPLPQLALFALGGYGRQELHPCSDVDVMVLIPERAGGALRQRVAAFVRCLWDLGIQISPCVRSVADCSQLAVQDITVFTSLSEARLLIGPHAAGETLRQALAPEHMWDSSTFFDAKAQEQQQRHARFQDTAYQLEPNVKEGPGGLRDLHTIFWVLRRHAGRVRLSDLVQAGYLTAAERTSLLTARHFLFRVRYALHVLAGRREDRLLFHYQLQVAKLFGYRGDNNRAVERFMQRYYQAAREVERLNQLLLQHFEESVLHRHEGRAIILPGGHFAARAGFLEAQNTDLFTSQPLSCLEAFWWLAVCPWLRGMRAVTLRQLHSAAPVVRALRHDPEAHRLFLGILRQSIHGATTLMEMNRYGVLGHYIPAFRRVTAHMQFDLFHTYTVDQHALFMVGELARIRKGHDHNRLCTRLMQRIPKPELLAIAALFHDLAKGRGGDHSRLGAALVRRFAKAHGLSSEQRELVAFLVANHLLLSLTAQRRDISDPQVITELTRQVGDPGRLDHLFLLTVADMRATNPLLLTAWKMSLLIRLYERAQEAFTSPSPQLVSQRLERRAKRQALRLLKQRQVPLCAIAQLWQRLNPDYFRQHDGHDVAAETMAMLKAPPGEAVVALYTDQRRSATVVFVASPPRDDLFVLISALIRQMGFAVEAADLLPRRDQWITASWTILEEDGQRITSAYRLRQLQQTLTQALTQPTQLRLDVNRTQSSRFRAFTTPIQAIVTTTPGAGYTQIELVAPDRPGLLSQFGQLLGELKLRLRSARVATIGERAEDVFLVTDLQNLPITDPAQLDAIAQVIEQHLGVACP